MAVFGFVPSVMVFVALFIVQIPISVVFVQIPILSVQISVHSSALLLYCFSNVILLLSLVVKSKSKNLCNCLSISNGDGDSNSKSKSKSKSNGKRKCYGNVICNISSNVSLICLLLACNVLVPNSDLLSGSVYAKFQLFIVLVPNSNLFPCPNCTVLFFFFRPHGSVYSFSQL